MTVIGLEVSTSAAKCILFSPREGIIDAESIRYPREIGDTLSLDPHGVAAAALDALKQVVGRNDRKVSAIGLGGTWHSMLLLDGKRQPLGRISTWADLSASGTVSKFRQDAGFVQEYYQKTGCMVHAMYPMFKYRHLTETQPELAAQVSYLSSQIEYLFEMLTGEAAVSRCIASGSGMFNIHTLDWDDDLLELLSLDRGQLAELKEATDCGSLKESIAAELGLDAGIPVTVGAADGAMNQVSIGGARRGVMSFSVGTSAAMRMVADEPKIPETPSTWCYYLYSGKRLVGAATQGACNCIDWFVEKFAAGRSYSELEDAARALNPENAPYFLPFIYGERCPGWQEDRPGGFLGLKPDHGLGELYYSILEGIIFNLYQNYNILTDVAEVPEQILVSGGIMNSPFWLQLTSDLFERELWTTGATNDSTLGAAIVAWESVHGPVEVQDFVQPTKVCEPSSPAKTAVYRKRFERYLQLYAGVGER